MDSLIKYSLNTPTNYNDNILNSKIINLIKNSNMSGGSSIDNSNCIIMIIGIVIMIIGFYLCSNKNDWTSTDAFVQNSSCESDSVSEPEPISSTLLSMSPTLLSMSSTSTQCKINITYIVNTVQYSKTIIIDKSAIPTNSSITIYYQESNPNIVRLYNFNYSIIGIVLIIMGAFVLISSLCCINNISSNSSNSFDLDTESNLYTNTRNSDGIKIVYTK